ncbi:uncharacterized protein PV07_09672 [Cladophialophora immunda]|uniref:Carboxyvinyl-carboxyphosphonate phosphorylmutase n=1 Tax=Cladophialophora immunda TaxID=569365 RepID=A0A0D2C7Z2_9EURO|nr:uncharacterized protein PV07_09672 [Cladophialophora immunda]KIW26590.1 hypothetical protein PV07_09672 [Cladophialophora immunda]
MVAIRTITQMTAAARLRGYLADPSKTLMCPGVYDGLSARMALQEGFDCLYMTGSGTSMSRLGMADLGLTTLNDMRDNAAMISSLDRRAVMVGRTVAQYMQAGVAALHLEDQVQNKRCGHLRNKELVSEEIYLSRIRAAVNMREKLLGDIVIIARTDALQSLGFEACIERLQKAVSVGADVVFLEGVETKEQAAELCLRLHPTPVLYNAVSGGVSPNISVAEARELGFKIVIFPSVSTRQVVEGLSQVLRDLKENGALPKTSTTPKNVFELCGLQEVIDFDTAAGGSMYTNGV